MKKNLGEALKAQRILNGYTQRELARQTGISQQTISKWEANQSVPNLDFFVQLADFYGISLDELADRD